MSFSGDNQKKRKANEKINFIESSIKTRCHQQSIQQQRRWVVRWRREEEVNYLLYIYFTREILLTILYKLLGILHVDWIFVLFFLSSPHKHSTLLFPYAMMAFVGIFPTLLWFSKTPTNIFSPEVDSCRETLQKHKQHILNWIIIATVMIIVIIK